MAQRALVVLVARQGVDHAPEGQQRDADVVIDLVGHQPRKPDGAGAKDDSHGHG